MSTLAKFRDHPLQLVAKLFLADSRIETTLIFHAGLGLPCARVAKGCVLLDELDYSARFGFSYRDELILESVQSQFFLARSFTNASPRGKVHYHRSFELCA